MKGPPPTGRYFYYPDLDLSVLLPNKHGESWSSGGSLIVRIKGTPERRVQGPPWPDVPAWPTVIPAKAGCKVVLTRAAWKAPADTHTTFDNGKLVVRKWAGASPGFAYSITRGDRHASCLFRGVEPEAGCARSICRSMRFGRMP